MAALLNPQMALILVAIVPVVGVLIFLSIWIGYPFFRKVQKALDRVNGVMCEYLVGVRVVKAFNRFGFEEERFAGAWQGHIEIHPRVKLIKLRKFVKWLRDYDIK